MIGQPDSLRAEWAYLHGRTIAPCSAAEMSARKVDPDDIAKVLADRVALNTDVRTTGSPGMTVGER